MLTRLQCHSASCFWELGIVNLFAAVSFLQDLKHGQLIQWLKTLTGRHAEQQKQCKTTHTEYLRRGAVSQRMEAEPPNQAGQMECGPQGHDEELGWEQPPLPGLLPADPHSPGTVKLRMLN